MSVGPPEIRHLLSWVLLDGCDGARASRLTRQLANHTPLIIATHVYIHKTATRTLSELPAAFLMRAAADGRGR